MGLGAGSLGHVFLALGPRGFGAGSLGQVCLALWAADLTLYKDSHPMVISKGKLRGDTPPNRVWIMWTAGWVEPCYKLMMVTIIHLSAGSTEPAVHTIRTRLGGVSPRSLWVGSTLVWWSIQVCWVQDLVFGVSISNLTN